MKRKYLFFIIPVFLLIAFFWFQTEDKNFDKVESLINQNAQQLVKDDNSSNKAEDRKLALEISEKIHLGECPQQMDDELKSYTIKKLASNSLNQKQVEEVINCIETLGINKDQHFTLMVDLLPFWNAQNDMLELFYTKFFKGYKNPSTLVLGLLDNAKLMCAKAGIDYLSKDGYPENYDKSMSKKEYALFEEYIDEYRCGGYSN